MDVLFITGEEYVKQIHAIPTENRLWYHNAYLWYHANAHRVLLCISIILTIYLAITYREVFAVAKRGNVKSAKYAALEQSGGFDLFGDNNEAAASFAEQTKAELAEEAAKPAKSAANTALDEARARTKAASIETQKKTGIAASAEKREARQAQAAQQKSEAKAAKQAADKKAEEDRIASSPEALKQKAKEAKAAEKREKKETKRALHDELYGKQSDRRSETAKKNIKAMKDAPGKAKEYIKSGQMKADVKEKLMQAKLKAHEKAVALHESIVQNSGTVYTWIFTIFIVSGVMVYFMPTIGMIGISILTFYMFRTFINDMLTL